MAASIQSHIHEQCNGLMVGPIIGNANYTI